jgi:YbbR domain-containing protein
MIRHNLGYKLMALAVALTLWFYVNSERNPQARKSFTVPIQMEHLADGYVAEPAVRDAIVMVEGLKSTVDAVGREHIGASVDLTGVNGNELTEKIIRIEPRLRESQGDVRLSVEPRTVKVRVEALGDKRLPVEVRFPAVPPLGYAYGNPEITPASVSLSGKVSEVARARKVILTLPSRVSNGPIDDSFEVIPVDSKGVPVTSVEMDAEKVRLKLELVEVPATKSVIVSPDVIGSPAFPARVSKISVTPSLVILQGRPAALTSVSTIDTDRISIEGATETVTREVDLHVPPGVKIAGGGRVKVKIHITSPEQQTEPPKHRE